MSTLHISAAADIAAPPDRVMAILTDYHAAHPAILPPAFTRLTVLEGGTGAGTVVDVAITAMGQTRVFHMTVTEPEPGRVLVEEDPAAGIRTTFTVDPLDGGKRSRVTIASDMTAPGGLFGSLQAAMLRRYTGNLYQDELKLLAAAAEKAPAP